MEADSQLVRLTAKVRGRVQGVSYRYATQRIAQRLDVSGWVRNEKDGSVTVVAQGGKNQLDELLAFLYKGPPSAIVDKVEVEWSKPDRVFSNFNILWI